MKHRRPKILCILEKVKRCISNGNYLDTRHALERQDQRNITRPEVIYVLQTGHHEKHKDKFDDIYNSWNYAIKGKTVDKKPLRIIVSFDENNMLIITAIELRN